MNQMQKLIRERVQNSIEVKSELLNDENMLSLIEKLGYEICDAIKTGHKIVICGNGGSACDAIHFAGEIVGRFQKERNAWPAITLNSDIASMTSIANDYGYEEVFARQAEAQCNAGDIFVGISTSGNSENVFRALMVAHRKGCKTVALLGKDGGKIAKQAEYPLIVHNNITARVQESHILLIHILCELIEEILKSQEGK